MEISGLSSSFQSIGNSKESASLGIEGFGSVFAALVGNKQPQANPAEKTAEVRDLIPFEDLNKLKELLLKNEVLDLEDGMALMDEVISSADGELLHTVLDYLGMTEEKWNQFTAALATESGIPLADGINFPEVISLLTWLTSKTDKEFASVLNFEKVQGLKVIKLLELLMKEKDSYKENLPGLKESLDKILTKVDSAVATLAKQGKTEFLQKLFTPLAEEINRFNQEKVTASDSSEQSKRASRLEASTNMQIFNLPVTKAEQLTLMLETASPRPASADQLIKQFEAILAKSHLFKTAGGTQKLFIKLFPEHLGAIRVELIQKDHSMIARIFTTNGQAKDLLDSQLNGLKQAFASQNLQVERVEVAHQSSQQDRLLNKDQQSNSQGQTRKEHSRDPDDKKEANLTFEDFLLNVEA